MDSITFGFDDFLFNCATEIAGCGVFPIRDFLAANLISAFQLTTWKAALNAVLMLKGGD